MLRKVSIGSLVALLVLALAGGVDAKPKSKQTKTSNSKKIPVVNSAPRGETELERQLQDELDKVLASKVFGKARNGVYVVDLATGKVLYAVGADEQLNPASNVKLVSTGAALDALGPDFRFRTRLLGAEPDSLGVIDGDAYLQGMWDFTLRPEHLEEIATGVVARGVKRIAGDVVVGEDDRRDAPHKATVAITVTGGANAGDLATVAVGPDSAYFVIENSAMTRAMGPRKVAKKVALPPRKGKKAKKKRFKTVWVTAPAPAQVTIDVREEDGRVVFDVTGKIRPGDSITIRREVPHPGLYAAHTVRAALLRAGVAVDGKVRRAPSPPEGLVELGAHESVALATLAARVNKPSNNYLADLVIEAAGSQLYGGEPNMEKGLRAMQSYLDKLGVPADSYRLDNGSGLSYTNHLSVVQIVSILKAASRDARIGADFVASLAIAGKDGTLRGRFAGRTSVGLFRGKTGTLTGVAALSGLVSIDGTDGIVFAVMTNEFNNRRKKEVRAGQATMVDAMVRYLRARAKVPEVPAAVLTEDPLAPAPDPDDEQDGDSDGAEPAVGDEPAATEPADPTATDPTPIETP